MRDVITEFPMIQSWAEWKSRYRPHIRCLVWWEELEKPRPKLRRLYAVGGGGLPRPIVAANRVGGGGELFYPEFAAPREWRTRTMNPPVPCKFWKFGGPRTVQAPALFVPGRGTLILDGVHRIKDLEPFLIILDAIELRKKEQLCAIADTIGTWWNK
jgi:hypothetical protein